MSCLIPYAFICFKLLIAQFTYFEFPVYRIILFGFNGFKGIILSFISFLGIPIRLRPLRWVILYKVLLYVLPGYVFRIVCGFLLRVAVWTCAFWVGVRV